MAKRQTMDCSDSPIVWLSPALAAVTTGFTWAVLDVKTWENRFLSGGTAASPTILQRIVGCPR